MAHFSRPKMAHFEKTVDSSFSFFIKPSKEEKAMMLDAIEQDLSRFLPPDVLDVHRQQKYLSFLDAARSLFAELHDKGVCLP